MTTFPDAPARLALQQVLKPLLPKGWTLEADDAISDDSDRTRVRISQRDIEPGGTGDARRHWITFQLTVTVPSNDGIAAAEQLLDDDMDAFLFALDAAEIPWTKASKGKFADETGRLGYSVDTRITTNRRKDRP